MFAGLLASVRPGSGRLNKPPSEPFHPYRLGPNYASHPTWSEWFAQQGSARRLDPSLGRRVGLSSLAISAAQLGLGVALGQRVLARGGLEAGRLIALSPFSARLGYAYCAFVPRSRLGRPEVASWSISSAATIKQGGSLADVRSPLPAPRLVVSDLNFRHVLRSSEHSSSSKVALRSGRRATSPPRRDHSHVLPSDHSKTATPLPRRLFVPRKRLAGALPLLAPGRLRSRGGGQARRGAPARCRSRALPHLRGDHRRPRSLSAPRHADLARLPRRRPAGLPECTASPSTAPEPAGRSPRSPIRPRRSRRSCGSNGALRGALRHRLGLLGWHADLAATALGRYRGSGAQEAPYAGRHLEGRSEPTRRELQRHRHFPWVHPGSFGGDTDWAAPHYDVKHTEGGLAFAIPISKAATASPTA